MCRDEIADGDAAEHNAVTELSVRASSSIYTRQTV